MSKTETMRMKKSGIVLSILMIFSLLSLTAFAQSLAPCDPANNNAECPTGETCQFYTGLGYACGTEPEPTPTPTPTSTPTPTPTPTPTSTPTPTPTSTTTPAPSPTAIPEEEEEPAFNVFDMFLGFDIAGSLLKEKILFTLHIIKEELFQVELKIVETSLAQNSCEDQPVSFAVSKSDYRYGKLEEIDALLNMLIFIADDNGEKYPIDTEDAQNFVDTAEQLEEEFPLTAFACKCLAYKDLLGLSDSAECPFCPEPNEFCEELCTNTAEDVNNCGSCGEECESGEEPGCCSGSCTDLNNDGENCGSCGEECFGEDPACCSGGCESSQNALSEGSPAKLTGGSPSAPDVCGSRSMSPYSRNRPCRLRSSRSASSKRAVANWLICSPPRAS